MRSSWEGHSVTTAFPQPLWKRKSLQAPSRALRRSELRGSQVLRSNPTGKLRFQEGQSFLRPPRSWGLRASRSRRGCAPPWRPGAGASGALRGLSLGARKAAEGRGSPHPHWTYLRPQLCTRQISILALLKELFPLKTPLFLD